MRLNFGRVGREITTRLANILADRRGNVAITVALSIVPLILAVGAGLDYARAYNVQSKMQSDLDAALVAAIKQIDDQDEDKLVKKIKEWFDAQADRLDSSYDLTDIKVDKSGHTIRASASGTVPTTLMTLANIKTVPVGVVSAIEGPATSHLNVYIVIDKSPSMLLAATSEGQAMLRADPNIRCEFACHSIDDPVRKDRTGVILASTYYDYIKNLGVKLRSDVALDAVEEVLDMVDAADADHSRIKVGLYSLGEGISEALAPTYSTSTARKKMSEDESGLTSETSTEATYFHIALKGLKKKVGKAGDGTSASSSSCFCLRMVCSPIATGSSRTTAEIGAGLPRLIRTGATISRTRRRLWPCFTRSTSPFRTTGDTEKHWRSRWRPASGHPLGAARCIAASAVRPSDTTISRLRFRTALLRPTSSSPPPQKMRSPRGFRPSSTNI
jgi:Flp pilus assembly protein TadG